MFQIRDDALSRTVIALGVVLAIVAFFIPLAFNQLVSSEVLHVIHKLLAYTSGVVVFAVWMTAMRHRTRSHSSNNVWQGRRR